MENISLEYDLYKKILKKQMTADQITDLSVAQNIISMMVNNVLLQSQHLLIKYIEDEKENILLELEREYKNANKNYSDACSKLAALEIKDQKHKLLSYKQDMNEGMCFAFDTAIEIVKDHINNL